MYGPTGPGKTSCVYAYAAEKKIPVVYTACNGAIDPATMFVRVMMDPDGRFQYVEMDTVRAMRYGPCIWLLDEINALPPRNAMVLHGALDKRRQTSIVELDEVVALHDETQIIGTYNPDYEGTKPLNEAFNNRFSIQLEFAYDPEIEKKLITGIPVLLELATKLRASHENQDLETPISPNLFLEFEQIAWEKSIDGALGNFVRRFKAHERTVVKNALTHYEARIRQQFKVAKEAE
jgi:nitric oxide reductase NorQ protein